MLGIYPTPVILYKEDHCGPKKAGLLVASVNECSGSFRGAEYRRGRSMATPSARATSTSGQRAPPLHRKVLQNKTADSSTASASRQTRTLCRVVFEECTRTHSQTGRCPRASTARFATERTTSCQVPTCTSASRSTCYPPSLRQ